MTDPSEKLTQNLMGTAWSLLSALKDLEFQRTEWAEKSDLHAIFDVVNDFTGLIEGLDGWSFAENLSYVYKSFGIPVANVLLPVYTALEASLSNLPRSADGILGFLESEEWRNVIDQSERAFQFVDRVIARDESGLPVTYNPTTWEVSSHS